MTITKRLIIATCLVLVAISGAVLGQHGSALAADGNSLAAATCQNGGYAGLAGVSGGTVTTFSNTGDCVSSAAQGGTLVTLSSVTPCLNGQYATLTTAPDAPVFPSAGACALFVSGGGTPITALSDLSLSVNCPTGGYFSCVYSVTNIGSIATSAPFTVQVILTGDGLFSRRSQTIYSSLQPGQTVTLTFPTLAQASGFGTLTLNASVTTSEPEFTLGTRTYQGTFTGP